MKDERPKVFKLDKTNSALDFLKNLRHRVLTTTELLIKQSNMNIFLGDLHTLQEEHSLLTGF